MLIDLRSDTVTRPTPEMMEFMLRAPVGDDVFNEDPSINDLQSFAADMFGKEAGLFCPSGTMTNQIAIKAQTQPGDEIVCEAGAHVYYYEGGGIAFNSGCTTKTLVGNRGVFTADQLMEALRPSDVHFPKTSLVAIENTCNRGGGKIFDFDEIKKIRAVCDENNLKLHLDGARLFNALTASQRKPQEIGPMFDSISICLSKGLGAPVGSLLLGNAELIEKAKRIRKVLGGGMRQAGVIASAGMYALQNHVERLTDDHELAKAIQKLLENSELVSAVLPVETNIVVFELKPNVSVQNLLEYLKTKGILAFQVGPQRIRFVTHLDLPKSTLEILTSALNSYSSESSSAS
ncbi:MAG: aminotransferase class I/II-fold pyridoxal phosphate-dependent enzyme [Flavobacteriales bacterium]|nr:aminotransferase class I/II-fold pyridoxal phosphate-dependent enzyme [Flavobacteriales bacterium]